MDKNKRTRSKERRKNKKHERGNNTTTRKGNLLCYSVSLRFLPQHLRQCISGEVCDLLLTLLSTISPYSTLHVIIAGRNHDHHLLICFSQIKTKKKPTSIEHFQVFLRSCGRVKPCVCVLVSSYLTSSLLFQHSPKLFDSSKQSSQPFCSCTAQLQSSSCCVVVVLLKCAEILQINKNRLNQV